MNMAAGVFYAMYVDSFDTSHPMSQSASQPASQSVSQPVSQSVSQPVSQSVSANDDVLQRSVVNMAAGVFYAMYVDSFSTSHPMSNPVESPAEIRAQFDTITYTKVSCSPWGSSSVHFYHSHSIVVLLTPPPPPPHTHTHARAHTLFYINNLHFMFAIVG